jgi:hypothetical protein
MSDLHVPKNACNPDLDLSDELSVDAIVRRAQRALLTEALR